MKTKLKIIVIAASAAAAAALFFAPKPLKIAETAVQAQTRPTQIEFDQKAAIAKLREQIKGKEQLPASEVFKNIQTAMLKQRPAAQLLAVMEFGFARSLGVNCTHCHVPDKWEGEDKPQKQIAREMSAMAARINNDLLKGIQNLKSESPTINCTTCHRGEVKPALNLPPPPKV